ncbi:plant/F14N23-31 protein [Senna tora]|uniref:Plant/F14N23-31 protein n=1 Tax=Senna tora TaxID=362788 RepID=A0A834X0A0_9FABA|nr:plant/F14N23-31 protein [Senna tora]
MFPEEECLPGYLRDHLIRSLLRNSFSLLFLHQYAFHKSIGEASFDSDALFDYDCDDDFYSVPNDVLSLNGIEGVCRRKEVELLQEEAESQRENRWLQKKSAFSDI